MTTHSTARGATIAVGDRTRVWLAARVVEQARADAVEKARRVPWYEVPWYEVPWYEVPWYEVMRIAIARRLVGVSR